MFFFVHYRKQFVNVMEYSIFVMLAIFDYLGSITKKGRRFDRL